MADKESYHVLLVDDETRILKGLQRNLMTAAPKWKISCTNNAAEAISYLEKHSVDVVVSDLRMPMMDGADFLLTVQEKFPQTLRFVLSGQASEDLMIKSSTAVHRYFTKPCDAQVLIKAVHDAIDTTQNLSDKTAKKLVVNLGQLPPMPTLYHNLLSTLRDPNSGTQDITKVLSQDPAMVTKVMQIANSAYFGTRGNIASLDGAILLLGIDVLKGLVLVGKAFEKISLKNKSSPLIQPLWRHSTQVSILAHSIALKHSKKKKLADESFTVALLHDIGMLILNEAFGEGYKTVLETSKQENQPIWQVEKDTYGNNHAEIGAHLLNLWGLPNAITEAVRAHHTPSIIQSTSFSSLTAVHIADVLDYTNSSHTTLHTCGPLDTSYLNGMGIPDNLDYWKELSEKEQES